MAKYRHVHVEFWQDPKVLEEMTPEDKLFYLYLLTNPLTTQIGVYKITKKQMAFELGYSIESISSLLDRFINMHKLVKYNEKTREIALVNWGKYNLNKAGKPIIDCIKKELKTVKDISLLKGIAEKVNNPDIRSLYEGYLGEDELYFEPSKIYKPLPGETITASKYVLWRDRQTCFYTGIVLKKEDVQIDHIKPKSLGGSGSPDNLVVSYSKFNNFKSGTRDLKIAVDDWNIENPSLPIDYYTLTRKLEALKEFELLRLEFEVSYRTTIENDIYDTSTLRKYIDTIRGQKEKEKEKEKKDNAYSNEFERFWILYPRKVDKKKAHKSFKTVAKHHPIETILSGTEKYAQQVQGTEKKFIKHPATFLNNESFIDGFEEVEQEKPKPQPKPQQETQSVLAGIWGEEE